MGHLRKPLAAAFAAVLVLGVAACGDDDDEDTAAEVTTTRPDVGGGGAGPSGDGEDEAGVPTLTIRDLAFGDVDAAAGETVRVANEDDVPHTVTADDGAFDVELDPRGEAALEVPAEPGSYAYHCEVHPSMTGTLEVRG